VLDYSQDVGSTSVNWGVGHEGYVGFFIPASPSFSSLSPGNRMVVIGNQFQGLAGDWLDSPNFTGQGELQNRGGGNR
jgi:hypothetical protein